ncbi:LamG domain-containing protein [Chitinophaga ginsengisoli]|uniref:3-keto-disaccharide hydrolase domain-containing protein n=1 Tax=Chitinophaga ginsengisoli TaxID=363837 RepID=A0A2P8GL58_9BACT|nr:hypothetical protein [Chitinophaga ginsengisoli]PSL34692.1 hypothetical protein CLV42_102265 [Chitinophaga ginsengisoli]
MYKTFSILSLFLFSLHVMAQQKDGKRPGKSLSTPATINVAMTADNWDIAPTVAELTTWRSVPALKCLGGKGSAVLKDVDFTDGTIEYDMEPVENGFATIFFRQASSEERECFYFRTYVAGNASAIDAIQYAPYFGGVNMWDMLPCYQANADFKREKWNHVKLVISGKQMWVYVNDMSRPALKVPRLEGNTEHGRISFEGKGAIFSNLVIKPGQTEGLSPLEGPDPTDNDPRYLREWQVSQPIETKDVDFSNSFMPGKEATWETIWAERRGLVDLTRKFGPSKERRIIWLKANIHTVKEQSRKMNLGFSDEVWVFINGKYVYVDKNLYGQPLSKFPDGRCSIENTSFNVPLKEGDNELLIGVANSFYGWGIVARLDEY